MHATFAALPHGMDFLWLFLLVVLLFGANKLPQLARGLGKSLGEFRRAKEDFEKELHSTASTGTGTGTEAKALENNPPGSLPVNSPVTEPTKKI